MKKYKHRLVIEVTFSEQITERDAALCLRTKLDSMDVFVDPVDNVINPKLYITNYVIKAFSKVTVAHTQLNQEGTGKRNSPNTQMDKREIGGDDNQPEKETV